MLGALLLASGVPGCAALVSTPAAFSIYDLGHPEPGAFMPKHVVPAAIEVRAPSWLSTTAMQYRLDYEAPASRDDYAESRWAGHPAEMLQRLLNAALVAGATEPGSCRLRIELDEFVQVFDAVDRSHAEILVRAGLLGPRDDTMLAQETFPLRVRASAANARGGVQAHREAATILAQELSAWLDALDGRGERLSAVAARCRR